MTSSRDFRVRTRWQLRVLNGPNHDLTVALEARLTIGRDPRCDLQLTAQEVSRQHARVVEDGKGRHVLVDLDSGNGTYVDGKRIRVHVLDPYAEITIADVELLYEPVPRVGASVKRGANAPTPRSTLELPALRARSHAPTTPIGIAVPPHAIRDRDGRALAFELPDGSEYPGNLLTDILEYRTLRARQLRGGFGDPTMGHAFEQLKLRLQQAPSADARLARRAFCRFACWLPARLQVAAGDERPCYIRDVGVDGAQIVLGGHGLGTETTVCLCVEVMEAGQRRSMAFVGRVAWIDGEFLGLTFAGAPRREDGRYAQRAIYGQPNEAEATTSSTADTLRSSRMVVEPRES
jgi:hypothetical protein